jgi:protein-disulfide isomerase
MLERKAAFDEPELLAQAAALGLDAAQFQQARKGPEVRARIEADIAEAMHFGLDGTPYIFVNGIELRGWRNARQVEQAVLSVAARELPFQTAEADRPRPGVEKFLGRWRSISPAAIPAATHGWPLGPADAHARIVWFGEHQSPQSAAASQAILAALEKYPQTRVEFRHFPLSKRGNPLRSEIQVDAFPLSYDLALLVHAAGRVGGRDGFWKMHRWVLAHQDQIDAGSAARAARELGLDPQAIQRELSNPETAAAVADDVALAAQLGVKFAPAVVVDGRPLEGVVSNPEIIERALQEFRANR